MSLLLALLAVAPTPVKPEVELLGGGGPVRRTLDKSSYLYRLLSPPSISKVEELPEEVMEAIEEVAQVTQEQSADNKRDVLEELGIAYRQAYKEIYLSLLAEMKQAREDEQVAACVAALI